jgi:hypothetical protein
MKDKQKNVEINAVADLSNNNNNNNNICLIVNNKKVTRMDSVVWSCQ